MRQNTVYRKMETITYSVTNKAVIRAVKFERAALRAAVWAVVWAVGEGSGSGTALTTALSTLSLGSH